jgi:alanyl-tRNA synthetase
MKYRKFDEHTVMTHHLYSANTYLFECRAKVIYQNESYIVLDQTIFYPQGGGQPCDCGRIISDKHEIQITSVRTVDGEIRHYGIVPDNTLGEVTCKIDAERRLLNAKYHTAGHLLAGCLEESFPWLVATKCHAFPGEAYVEFSAENSHQQNELIAEFQQQTIQKLVNNAIRQNITTKVFEIDKHTFEKRYYKINYQITDAFRVLQIGNYKPVPCGGTHLFSTAEIGCIMIKRVKLKGLKVSYEIYIAR